MASEDKSQNYNSDIERMAEKLNVQPPQPIETPKEETASQLSQILSGWGNRVKDAFGMLDDETKAMSEARLKHCDGCYMRTNNTCDPRKSMKNNVTGQVVTGCGCNISAKSMSRMSRCPLGKWDKIEPKIWKKQ